MDAKRTQNAERKMNKSFSKETVKRPVETDEKVTTTDATKTQGQTQTKSQSELRPSTSLRRLQKQLLQELKKYFKKLMKILHRMKLQKSSKPQPV